ncbi:hypothetical protein A2U01_0043852 [Trifolium medium]|uniref:Uncharacterized protein n=1 Tax=Trifolium medium TaxID=97028 RepID=A0A392QGL4_9FABA|nr:hypothetical protein [Trifolium medium]
MENKASATYAELQRVCLRINRYADEECHPCVVESIEGQSCFDPVFHDGGQGCNHHGYLASVQIHRISAVVGIVLVMDDGSHVLLFLGIGGLPIENALEQGRCMPTMPTSLQCLLLKPLRNAIQSIDQSRG